MMNLQYCIVEEGTRGRRLGLRKESRVVSMTGEELAQKFISSRYYAMKKGRKSLNSFPKYTS
jgi:hypothetical protein